MHKFVRMRYLNFFFFFFFLFTQIKLIKAQDVLTSVYPKTDGVEFDENITFHWNRYFSEKPIGAYNLYIYSDSALTNSVYSNIGLTNNIDSFTFNSTGEFYWKVSYTEGNVVLAELNTLKFNLVDIYNLPNITLFFRADSGIVESTNGTIEKWINLVDTSNSAIQNNSSQQPLLINSISELNNNKIVRLDGIDDLLQINSAALISDIYMVANYTGGPNFTFNNGLLTGQNAFHIFAANVSSVNLLGTTLYPNFELNKTTSYDFSPMSDYKILNAYRNGGFSFANLNIGRDRTFTNRYWKGDVAELIAFSSPLSDSLKGIVDSYLCNKYGNNLYLGEDIFMTYGFCDTLVNVDTSYTSYLWSNGDTTSFSSLVPGNSYKLTVTNKFGCQFEDEISVVSTQINSPNDQLICIGDTFVFNTGLSKSDYSFLWNDLSTDSSLIIRQSGRFFTTITDSNGCIYNSDTLTVSYDSSLVNYTLGNDLSLCKGNSIGLINADTNISTYEWSTGNTNPTQVVDTSGIYSLEITNNKCSSFDTISVTIRGEAPNVGFIGSNFCFLDTVQFIDTSLATGNVNLKSWSWDFGDGDTSVLQNPTHYYDTNGIYNVMLSVQNDSNCTNSISIPIEVFPKPDAEFTVTNVCEKDSTLFTDATILPKGFINSYLWDFGVINSIIDTSIIQNPKFVYDTTGSYQIELIVSSNSGCLDSISRVINISDSPKSNFTYLNGFKDDSVSFINSSFIKSGSIVSYNWSFGNNLMSNSINPKSFYPQVGKYLVSLTSNSDLGCNNTFSDSIEIILRPPPVPDFNTVTPKYNELISNNVGFSWNKRDSSTSYKIQIASDTSFQNLIKDTSFIVRREVNINLEDGFYYWRVIAKRYSNDIDTSNISSFKCFSMSSIDSLNLWLIADSGVVDTNGFVISWNDLSDSNLVINTLSQNRQTQVIRNGLNGYDLVDFDVNGDMFQNAININNKNYYISVVYNFHESIARTSRLLNSSQNWRLGPYLKHRVYNGPAFVSDGTSIIQDQFVVNTAYSANDTLFHMLNNSLLGNSSVGVAPGLLNIGTFTSEFFNGSIAEIIMVNGSLDKEEANNIQSYLMNKYAPPVNLNGDKFVCSFPQKLDAYRDSYLSYQWNTGSTDSILLIDSAGKYAVTITDMFNRTSVDSMFFILDTFDFQVELISSDTTICPGTFIELLAGEDNLSYSWNTNDTLPLISADSSIKYFVSTTNCLGNVSQDSIQININNPIFSLGNDTSICFNNAVKLFPDSVFSNVSYLWSNGSNLDSLVVNLPKDYSLRVTDTFNCSFSDTIRISVDSSLFGLNIGPDTSLCKGNKIGIVNPITGISSYNWSNGLNSPNLVLDSTSNYSLTITKNGCSISDTALILIKGDVPFVDFTKSNFCLNDSVIFIDQSIAPSGDTLESWSWDFGDGNNSNNQFISYQYSSVNSYNIVLRVTTNKGCSDTSQQTISVNPLPVADFSIQENCSKSPISFTDNSTVSSGLVLGYTWNFGDPTNSNNISNAQNPYFVYDTLGSYDITLISETDKGCRDTIKYSKWVNPSPAVNYTYNGTCLGDTTKFFDQTILPVGSIDNYLWGINWLPNQSGNFTSLDSNPILVIPIVKEVKVSLRIVTDSGCVSTFRDTFNINPKPIANFAVDDNCINSNFLVNNTSSISDDSIVLNRFIFKSDTSLLENPMFISDSVGDFAMNLFVESSMGCSDSITKNVPINSLPKPNFRILNNNTGIPFTLNFQNTSTGAQNYIWSFGNGDTLHGLLPNYTYTDTGSYSIKLKAISNNGCVDSISRTANSLPFYLDASLGEIYLSEESNGFLNVAVQILNTGNNTIEQIDLVADLNSEFQFQETMNNFIYSREIKAYQFNSSFIQNEGNEVNFVCVRIASVNGINDSDLMNNSLCKEGFNEDLFVNIFPNPTSGNLNIDYVLPKKGNLRINIYDRLGKRVVEEFNRNALSGIYKIQFNTAELRPGLYHYEFVFEGTKRSGTFVKL